MLTAILVAAGTGQRFGASTPKQYLQLRNKPLVSYSLEVLSKHPSVQQVLLVVQPSHQAHWQPLIEVFPSVRVVNGGATRQQSVVNALDMVTTECVLIHDAARPLLTAAMVDACVLALAHHDAVILAQPVADTLKKVTDTAITHTVNRDGLWAALTPQVFKTKVLRHAYGVYNGLATDDASIIEAHGSTVHVIPCPSPNIKVTYPEDIAMVERLLPTLIPHTGTGFDVHAFGHGDHVTLCGVRIPFTHGLAAHSDGDVALHALTDALLGGLGMGDIGEHFPPSEARWRGADSAQFVRYALDALHARGGVLYNVDITLICEQPKLTPHKPDMRLRLQEILGIEAVNVKATTTEKLGFTGRGEGIAAQAAVMLGLPQ
jgi:2-C-methyl-D-erythritol 4-phosphate cytidylyltransferase/2-C-methyl-D-erythritol 2,4-cyclodiphosphate synthase